MYIICMFLMSTLNKLIIMIRNGNGKLNHTERTVTYKGKKI